MKYLLIFILFLASCTTIDVNRIGFDKYNDSCTKYLCLSDCANISGRLDSAHYYFYLKAIPFNDSMKYYYAMLYPVKPLTVVSNQNKQSKCNCK